MRFRKELNHRAERKALKAAYAQLRDVMCGFPLPPVRYGVGANNWEWRPERLI